MEKASAGGRRPRVVMLPWLGHSHIFAFLELSRKLVQRGLTVFFCSTPSNLAAIEAKLRQDAYAQIKPMEIRLPPTPGLPPNCESPATLPHSLIPLLSKTFDSLGPAFLELLRDVDPDCVIHDVLPWAPAAASELGILAIPFLTVGSAATSYIFGKAKGGHDFPWKRRLPDACALLKMDEALDDADGRVSIKQRMADCLDKSGSIVACKTHVEIESGFLDYLSAMTRKRAIPVGLLLPEGGDEQCRQAEWLDRQPGGSVVYAAFGSEYFMTKDEIREIALGLELCGLPFIWVVRFVHGPDGGEEMSLEESLPSGFLERVTGGGGRGMVVGGWASQMKILSHGSVGGFLTHCGWGSLTEGIGSGVPLIALPLHLEQPINAQVAAGELGVGVMVEREEDGGFKGNKIAKGIRRVMVEEEGAGVRRAAEELAKRIGSERDADLEVVVNEVKSFACKRRERGAKDGKQ
ncbi:UDP-glucosyltransferase 29-like [Nymphaea colorata]|uniref:Glycosyltransferase n=1 Tax=Nymphaea colorata TaxID=210225 RepID=A0A5K1BGZ7_9MAGN|nr:UDP-glucosyltransferase 29-like [Nymphaea colorata]